MEKSLKTSLNEDQEELKLNFFEFEYSLIFKSISNWCTKQQVARDYDLQKSENKRERAKI